MNKNNRWYLYIDLMRLNRPIGILLLLWPTLWAIWIASNGHPDWKIVTIFVLGTILMRSAGCVINDFADRDIDPHVKRTAHRPLASQKLSSTSALILALGLSLLAFLLILPLNHLTLLLALPALFLAASYPWTKRFFAIPQAYLGIAFGFGIPMAFSAIQESIPTIGWLMLLANIFWTIAYDTEYAMTDREDDLKIGIKTSAITFGRYDILAIMLGHMIFISIMATIGIKLGLGNYYFSGLALAIGFIVYQYRMIRHRSPQRCLQAFLQNNWVGGSIFLGVFLDYLMK